MCCPRGAWRAKVAVRNLLRASHHTNSYTCLSDHQAGRRQRPSHPLRVMPRATGGLIGQRQSPLIAPLEIGQRQSPLIAPLEIGQRQSPLIAPLEIGQCQSPLIAPLVMPASVAVDRTTRDRPPADDNTFDPRRLVFVPERRIMILLLQGRAIILHSPNWRVGLSLVVDGVVPTARQGWSWGWGWEWGWG